MSSFAPYAAIVELGRALRDGSTSPAALAEQYLQRIEKLNGKLGAFQRVTPERVRHACTELFLIIWKK